MYRFVILSVVVVSALADDMDIRECGRIFHPPPPGCCKENNVVKNKEMLANELKECFDAPGPKDPVKCELDLCIAKKRGFATDDGKLDLKKFEEVISKDVTDKDVLDEIKTKCINGDLNNYGPPDFCDFIKIKHCVTLHLMNQCSEWSDDDKCQKVKELVGKCAKVI
nr:odorant binding protein 16 [Spodoptera frugiperda]